MRLSPLFAAVSLAAIVASAAAGEAEIRAAVKTLNAQAVVDSVKPSPAQGWSEVSLGGQIVYFSNDGKHLLQGALVEVASKRNLTEEAQSVARFVEMKKVDPKEMIIFPAKGTPKHKIKVFTDIDCGYCRKLHQEMAQYNDLGIEMQYLWFPRAGVPSESSRKAIAVHCAKDQRKAMTDAKNGVDPGAATCVNPIEKDYNLGQRIGVSGTPALILEDGTLMPGYMPAAALLAELEKRKSGAKK